MRDKLRFEKLDEFIERHDVFYIRHDFDTTEQIYNKLISDGLVAVHYGTELKKGIDKNDPRNRENPENFKGNAGRVLSRFKQCCNEGAIVFADYSNPPVPTIQKGVNMGIIPEGTNYEVVPYYGHKDYPKGLIYEQARLEHCKTFSYANIEPFLAIHPRGGTLVHWKQAEQFVKFVYRKELGLSTSEDKPTFEMLFPAQQEVLCSEFLRKKAPKELRLDYLLLPVGRGMKTIDIDGANKWIHLIAQVSFSTTTDEVSAKIEEMENLAAGYKGKKKLVQVYFGPSQTRSIVTKLGSSVKFFSLEETFDAMKETGILNDMLGLSSL
jgi:hypothetical protein